MDGQGFPPKNLDLQNSSHNKITVPNLFPQKCALMRSECFDICPEFFVEKQAYFLFFMNIFFIGKYNYFPRRRIILTKVENFSGGFLNTTKRLRFHLSLLGFDGIA